MRIEIGTASCEIWPETGAVGSFSADDRDSSLAVLAEAEAKLRDLGCEKLVGPMDGNTWQKYRFVTESDGSEPFLTEPRNPPEWPQWWKEAGWEPLAEYVSSKVDLASAPSPGPGLAQRIRDRGVSIREVNLDDYESELLNLYPFLLDAFSRNFLYTPIDEAEYLGLYLPARPLIDPNYVRIAECGNEPVGLVFCLVHESQLIVKTLASGVSGVGSLLLADVHGRARDRGIKSAIHALKHVGNTSVRVSEKQGGVVFRRYTLFEK